VRAGRGRSRGLLIAPGARAGELEDAVHERPGRIERVVLQVVEDGTLNVTYNCLDRHFDAGLGAKTAIIFEADAGKVTKVSYSELLARICQLANALKARGVKMKRAIVL
jgi:hypothetical protein